MYSHLKIIIDDNDSLYIASDYPYTYSDLTKFIESINSPNNSDRIKVVSLCKTLAGNDLFYLLISNFNSNDADIVQRPAIILTARVHPG